MISQAMFRAALIEAGAKQVDPDALHKWERWMERYMVDIAHKSVGRMQKEHRVRILARDIGED